MSGRGFDNGGQNCCYEQCLHTSDRNAGGGLQSSEQSVCGDFVGTINFLRNDLSMMGEKFAEDMASKRFMVQAVRPEYISVLPGERKDGISGRVQFVEFHGNNYRVMFEIQSEEEKGFRKNLIQVDVTGEVYARLNIRPGDIYCLKFHEDRVFYYLTNQDVQIAQELLGISDAMD